MPVYVYQSFEIKQDKFKEGIENLQEMKNINTALVLCDLIHFSQNSQYEATKIYGIHHTILTEQERSRDVSHLFRDLKSMLTLIILLPLRKTFASLLGEPAIENFLFLLPLDIFLFGVYNSIFNLPDSND